MTSYKTEARPHTKRRHFLIQNRGTTSYQTEARPHIKQRHDLIKNRGTSSYKTQSTVAVITVVLLILFLIVLITYICSHYCINYFCIINSFSHCTNYFILILGRFVTDMEGETSGSRGRGRGNALPPLGLRRSLLESISSSTPSTAEVPRGRGGRKKIRRGKADG